ncbi:MAG: hypothetical protein VKJ04_02725 [Vampirovibrionales bacterium]|nr:hypothetical protein [Vampirovibrionales bacterium]
MASSKKSKKTMPLAQKSAGMSASAVTSLAVVISMLKSHDPFQIMILAIVAGTVAGVLGFWIGMILEKPKSKPAAQRSLKQASGASARRKGGVRTAPEVSDDYGSIKPVTGEESFLNDLDLGSHAPDAPEPS